MSQNAECSIGASGRGREEFIGSWRLVETTSDGKLRPERGANPIGMITYHESGWMSAQIQPDRPSVGMAGVEPTGEEAKAALFGYTAYMGTYTVDEKRKIVIHHRKASISPGWEKRRISSAPINFRVPTASSFAPWATRTSSSGSG